MDIMVAVCEIKKETACEENFWERDIHYVIKSDDDDELFLWYG